MPYCYSFTVILTILFTSAMMCNGEETDLENTEEDPEDFAPQFFGGRMNDKNFGGMSPPSRRNGNLRSLTNVKIKYFDQKLDHFDLTSATWRQRYFVNDKYFQRGPNGTVFLIIGGEEPTFDEYRLIDGPIARLAIKNEASILGLEHRFYGESKPTKDASQKNLAFLNSRQALEDLNRFIKVQRKCKYPGAKFILYGCSYAGSLAAYFAALYPQSITGAISCFAPLLGIENFSAYFVGVAYTISKQSMGTNKMDCAYLVLQSMIGLNRLIKTRDNEKLQSILNLCEPKTVDFDNPTAIDSMFYNFTAGVMSRVQYNQPRLGSKSDLYLMCSMIEPSSSNCTSLCAEIGNKTEQFQCCQLERFARYLNETNQKCVRHDGKSMKCRNSGWDSRYVADGTRQWLWQACTEFGYFTTTEQAEGLKELKMRINLGYLKKGCLDSFNISSQEVKENVDRTNSFYGAALQQHSPENVFFLGSEMDPWYKAYNAAVNTLAENAYRNGTEWRIHHSRKLMSVAHCEEPMNDRFDANELRIAWEKIDETIKNWMKSV